MNPSPFSEFGFPGTPGKPNAEKGEVGGVGGLPRAAASAAFPWATLSLPLRGAGRALRRWFVPSPRSLHEVPASKGRPGPEPSELPRGFGVRQCSAALGVGEVSRKRQSTAALQDAGAQAQARAGSGAQSASEYQGRLSHFKLSHSALPYYSNTRPRTCKV
jgi:hypothetical protein